MHIMLDLETLSSASDAAIVAIGAVRFDIREPSLHHMVGDTFYRVINANSAQRAGGRIDGDTFIWWLKQSAEARNELASDSSVPIESALKEFSTWFREKPCDGIWGNGADFDNVILTNAYHRIKWTQPWPYAYNRCYRTIRELLTPGEKPERFGTHHNALDDAVTQANHLVKIIKNSGITL